MSRKILIATGGTGGHIYPAIGLAQQLLLEVPDTEILFVGGGLESNRYFDSKKFSSESISCGFFAGHAPLSFIKASLKISKGIWQSKQIIRKFMPDVVVGFGSFYAFPSIIAAKWMSIPIILHEANIIPGKVNRILAKWANVTGVHFPETVHLLKGKSVEVGVPLREGFKHSSMPKTEAIRYFGLNENKKTVLIFGGSQGAAAINRFVKGSFDCLYPECADSMHSNGKKPVEVEDCKRSHTSLPEIQVLHIAGEAKFTEELQKFYAQKGITACVKSFENRMDIAWQAADLAITRSGAGTIAEQLEFEVPGILIPFPRATDNHQEHNADFMVATVGGAVKFLENDSVPSRIALCITDLLKDEYALLLAMQTAMNQYKKRARTRDLCSLVKEFLY
jgi:UDP-N-acetylglucosamine--N-acetylmuramyl-(pentapeptide) pyrophosphoryl-undecaprenol N-acetylglucosamine transferase